jgi:hypothetical protein
MRTQELNAVDQVAETYEPWGRACCETCMSCGAGPLQIVWTALRGSGSSDKTRSNETKGGQI